MELAKEMINKCEQFLELKKKYKRNEGL